MDPHGRKENRKNTLVFIQLAFRLVPMKEELDKLLPPRGGCRHLKTFQMSRLVYDITLRFCDLYVPLSSRAHDQMVQAARSGVQNIAEGSAASGTSKKFEMKLTGVAWASLGELELDHEDYLRHWGPPQWKPTHPVLNRFKQRRYHDLRDFRRWIADELNRPDAPHIHPCPSMQVHVRPCLSPLTAGAGTTATP